MIILSYCKRLALGSVLLGSALTMGSCGDEYSYFTVNMNFCVLLQLEEFV